MNYEKLGSNPASKKSINSEPINTTIDPNNSPDIPPGPRLLDRCSETGILQSFAHPLTKTAAGVMAAVGVRSCYVDDNLCSSWTNYGTWMIFGGTVLWFVSTLISTGFVCQSNPKKVAEHVAASIGYAVGGVILVPLNIVLNRLVVDHESGGVDDFRPDPRPELFDGGRHSKRLSHFLEGQEDSTNDWQNETQSRFPSSSPPVSFKA